ncbi:MAG TPA: ATP-grasp domain-containing protein [Methanocorpusculum sp.]|nr:ATP-grasp domain-containing protein [Methanocorpusculum sp.]
MEKELSHMTVEISQDKSILVAGYTTRGVVQSAFKAGYRNIYAVDHFCDIDLMNCVKYAKQFNELNELPPAINEIISQYHIDGIITTSGAELLNLQNRIGSNPETIARFMNKKDTQIFLEDLNVPVPKLLDDNVYPAMMKPIYGAGGWRNKIVMNEYEQSEWEDFIGYIPYIKQEIIEGIPASVSCISNGKSAIAIASNEQILRGGTEYPYAFSGSVTPCTHPMSDRMMDIAEQIVTASGCIGSVGVDFVLTDTDAYAIEINPRFQGTVDSVELSTRLNLFKLHVDACNGIVPTERPIPKQFCIRKIVTALNPCTIQDSIHLKQDFNGLVTDIPQPNTKFKKGDVMFACIGVGFTKKDALISLDKNISNAIQYIME